MYCEDGILFCKFCGHSVHFLRVDTIKDHLKSKKHISRKEAKLSQATASTPELRQVTLGSVIKSKDLREVFILDFIKLCTSADIPLEKTDKMKPFLLKYCKQAGALPQTATLRTVYVPRLFDIHFAALKELLKDAQVSITADETTDVRDQSILNVVAGVRNKSYLIGVEKMEACNHATVSQAIIRSVTEVGIRFENVIAIVSDSAAYCKKAYNRVLSPVFPNSLHVLCIAHIVNLSAEIFQKSPDFGYTADLISMIKSSLFKKPGRKSRFLKFLSQYIPKSDVKLPPVPVSTRWNSWFEAANYHATRIHLYEGFYKVEKGPGMAVQRIVELLTHKVVYPEICLQLYFIKENCQRLITTITSLESKEVPLACTVYNTMEDLRAFLKAGITKTSFGPESDRLLSKLQAPERKRAIAWFQKAFRLSAAKLDMHLDKHPVYAYYKAARVFDPRQLPIVDRDIALYGEAIKMFKDPSAALLEEWLIYTQFRQDALPTSVELPAFWDGMKGRFPLLATIAVDAMWMPVTSVDVERSFSQYKHLLNDRRESLN